MTTGAKLDICLLIWFLFVNTTLKITSVFVSGFDSLLSTINKKGSAFCVQSDGCRCRAAVALQTGAVQGAEVSAHELRG